VRPLKKITQDVLKVLPNEGRFIKRSVRHLLVKKEIALTKLRSIGRYRYLPDPRAVYWIDPLRIEYHTSLKNVSWDPEAWVFEQKGRVRTVQGGDWDLSAYRVADMRICRAVKDRIAGGATWESTDYYKIAIKAIEAGHPIWGCSDRVGFKHKCEEVDRLIESIARDGYVETERTDWPGGDSPLGHGEVIVNIGRNGVPLFQDGRHRLAIARALGIRQIPVQVLVRHSEWQGFREFMHRMASGGGGAAKKGYLYQNPIHFDLVDVPSEHFCEDRWRAMSEHLGYGNGAALDIGCNLAYFCHGLEAKGYSAVGVEYLPEVAYAARKIATAEGRTFRVVEGDIFSDATRKQIGSDTFAVIVAVNIFHHFLKSEAGFKRLEQLVRGLRCELMFFEPHHPADPQMANAYRNPLAAEFAKIIAEWGGFRSSVPIYTAQDGRIIFKLSQ
jgi:2-polyprenyl-3-methyl-5-hydroxy-6-metoxy-1,4-benzoquinol methylase